MLRFKILVSLACVSFAAFSQEVDECKTIVQPDSAKTQQIVNPQVQIDSLNNVISTLKDLHKEALNDNSRKDLEIKALQGEIATLKETTIKNLSEKNDSLIRKFISMGSNFLYIPYEEYSINKIAVPSFKVAEGTPFYGKYKNRLALLENYKNDISAIIAFLNNTNKQFRFPDLGLLKENGAKCIKELEALPCYQRYAAYDDWKNTYLGRMIAALMNNYSSPSENDTYKTLESIKTKLESLLNNNQ